MRLNSTSLSIALACCALIGSASAATGSNGLYKTCALAPTGPRVFLYRSAKINDSFRYALQIGKAAQQPIFESEDEGDRGSSVKLTCVGPSSARALVVQGEFFGSAYPKGFVVLWNPFLRETERIDFSEKSFPTRIYVDNTGARVVVPNKNGETAEPFVVYTYAASTKRTTASPLSSLPVRKSRHEFFYSVRMIGQ